MTAIDRRIVPLRGDLAAEHLRGLYQAPRYVTGVVHRVVETAAPLRCEPNPAASLDTEALFGEAVTIYDELEGWAWGQLARDGYVGWMPANALAAPLAATHRVSAVRTFVYPAPSIKLPNLMALSMGSEVTVTGEDGLFLALKGGGFVFARHLAPLGAIESDPVSVAEQFVGTPYLWGGRTSLGLDCSALVQTALNACGIPCPRDSDMQERDLGHAIDTGADLGGIKHGDLLFWKGHVAMVRDASSIIHATGHTMTVIIEPLDGAMRRIGDAGESLQAVKRLG